MRSKDSGARLLPVFPIILAILVSAPAFGFARTPANIKAVYLPPPSFTDRKISEFMHYADLAGLNAAVLHVKDPRGRIHWKSNQPLALAIGAPAATASVEPALKRLKSRGFWTIAKLGVFVDHRLVTKHPEMGTVNILTELPWMDKKGLAWADPYNQKVWEYNIGLCRELAALGFDEIQFDYIRFPSDGDLEHISYPSNPASLSKTQCIGKFLESAYHALHPLGVTISVDLFGMVAWKTVDFGVGQLLETIAPHVDVICPMLYPSHFSRSFLESLKAEQAPEEIMELSLERIQNRTDKIIRPWIQGFWYSPGQINAQLDGVANANTVSWAVWNPSGNYATTYTALAQRLNRSFPEPRYYPSVAEFGPRDQRVIAGQSRVVNLTDYKKGYSIVSLERSGSKKRSAYTNLIQVLETMDEGIMDRILTRRQIPFSRQTDRYPKKLWLAELLCRDLQIDSRVLRPRPIYVDWQRSCRFSLTVPQERLESYRAAAEAVFAPDRSVYARLPKSHPETALSPQDGM